MLSDISRPKGVFTPLVVDNLLNGDEHAIFRQRVVGRLDQVFLFRQIPVVQDHPIVITSAFGSGSRKKSPTAVWMRSDKPSRSIVFPRLLIKFSEYHRLTGNLSSARRAVKKPVCRVTIKTA